MKRSAMPRSSAAGIILSAVAVAVAGGMSAPAASADKSSVGKPSADKPSAGKPVLKAFRDTFGVLDRRRWSVSDGWSNKGVFNVGWGASQATVTDGQLRLGLADMPGSGRPFTAGEVQSKRFAGYGSFEVVLRAAPGGPGMVTGFFTYSGPYFGTSHEEVDFEWLGARPHAVQVNYFSGGTSTGGTTIELGFDATREHHLYRFDWEPGRITWYVDGHRVHQEDGHRLRLSRPPAKIMAHVWAGVGKDVEQWLGGRYMPPRNAAGPVKASITCISYVPLGQEGARCSDPR